MVYDGETRRSIQVLDSPLERELALDIWETALKSNWKGDPVWVHGDLAPGNILVYKGQLHAVIDFGSSAIGDPACDLTIAWTFLSNQTREVFKKSLGLDEATWQRARGWTLWKALIALAEHTGKDMQKMMQARDAIDELFSDKEANSSS